jgi:GT2 family glycosyltransferase
MDPSVGISVSVIIVNYRSAAFIIDCLDSLYRFNNSDGLEVIVVDNFSGDDSEQVILSRYPNVRWHQMGYNAGFARGNNAGMAMAGGRVFLLLNPDTISIDDSISRCYHQLQGSGYIAAGVQQLNADHSPQISGNFFVRGGLNHLLPIPYWGGFIRWLGYRAKTKLPNIREAKGVEEVDWISGAFLMVKKTAVEKAGHMDEDFFLYAEEVEWCSRLREFGKLCIFGDLRIIHLESGSINKDQQLEEKGYYNLYDRKGLQLMVSNHLRVRKQYGSGWFLFLLLQYTWGVLFFWIAGSIHRLLTLRNPFGHWNQVGAFARNVARLWTLSPRIVRNKPHFYKMF